ncbi:hypothetical protein Aperf_G00000095900 [Anoplocephala perfoliata]
MRPLTALVGPLFLLLCLLAFVQPAELSVVPCNFVQSIVLNFLRAELKAIMENPASISQRISQLFDQLLSLLSSLSPSDEKAIMSVLDRLPKLDQFLLELKPSTLALLYRGVDERILKYLQAIAPQAVARAEEYLKHGDVPTDDESGNEGQPDSQPPQEEKPPQDHDERDPQRDQLPPLGEPKPPQDPPIQDPYEGEKPREDDKVDPEQHQDSPPGQGEPSYQYPQEYPPTWLGLYQPPYGIAGIVPIQYPFVGYILPVEEEVPDLFYEREPEKKQSEPQSPNDQLSKEPTQYQPPYVIIEQYPYEYYRWPHTYGTPFEVIELEPEPDQYLSHWEDGPSYQYPYDYFPEQLQRPYVLVERSPIQYYNEDYQWPYEEEVEEAPFESYQSYPQWQD